jgi:hypothetical protein
MARQFGSYSPAVPLGLTWEETLVLTDDAGTAIDLTGYAVRAQLRDEVPVVDDVSGEPLTDPVMELTSAGYYATAPAWPVVEGFSIPTPADGTMLLAVPADDTWTLSPDNAKRKLVWDVRLVNPDTGYAIPVVQGKVTLLPARTV